MYCSNLIMNITNIRTYRNGMIYHFAAAFLKSSSRLKKRKFFSCRYDYQQRRAHPKFRWLEMIFHSISRTAIVTSIAGSPPLPIVAP